MKISTNKYRAQKWAVHNLAKDFSLIDCWELPIPPIGENYPFKEVYGFLASIDPAQSNPITKFLFGLRRGFGKALNLDENSWLPIPKTEEMSLAERLSDQEIRENLASTVNLPSNKTGKFRTVFLNDKEGIIEISNKTIFALIHFGLTDKRKVWMGIYIKSRGALSDFYMLSIRPFRHLIVYPTWLRHIEKEWSKRK